MRGFAGDYEAVSLVAVSPVAEILKTMEEGRDL